MSKPSPRYCIDMAEHSMCQPGRPGPHGVSHAGSPGLEAFHSAKSSGSRLRSSPPPPPAPRHELLQVLPREPAVGRKPPDLEVDVTVDGIGHALADQPLDEGDHLPDMLGGLGLPVSRQHAERRHVGPALGDVALGDLVGGHALLVGPPDDLVVHVGVVLHERDLEALEYHVAADDVEHDGAARVPDVAEVVHRDAADVYAGLAHDQGDEILLAAGPRGEDLERHQGASTLATAMAAMPSSRPSSPRRSGLLALTLTRSGSTPSEAASCLAISGRKGPSRGDWQMTVASTLTSRAPFAASRSITERRSARLETPL